MTDPDCLREYDVNQLPFLKSYVVRGKITNPEYSVENVRTEIRYLEVGEGPILGAFYGGPDIWDKVVRALSHSDAKFVGVWSPPNLSYELTFKLENIIFGSVTTSFKTDCICNFECLNMEIQEVRHEPSLGDNPQKELEISYVIPYRSELFMPRLPDPINLELPWYQDQIEFDSALGKIVIETDEHFPRSISENKSISISAREQRITFCLQSSNENSNELTKEADEIAETVLLVISHLCKQSTHYYKRFESAINKDRQRVYGITTIHSRSKSKKGFTPIRFSKPEMRRYLTEIFSSLIVKNDKTSIEEAIILQLAANDAQYDEQKLIMRQSGIEVIVNTCWKRFGLVSATCPECGLHKDKLKDRLLETITRLEVDVSDLYPSVLHDNRKTFPFIGFRNKILHGQRNKIKDLALLFEEITRQEFLLHRLILHSIGINVKQIPVLNQAGFWLKPY